MKIKYRTMDSLRINTVSRPAPTYVALQLNGETSMTEIMRALRMIRGIDSAKPITRWNGCVTPDLSRKIAKAHRDSARGKTLSFQTAADAQRWMDSL